jgi:hypothetical protein
VGRHWQLLAGSGVATTGGIRLVIPSGGALLEIDASAAAFERLGARLDLVRARALASELRTIA